MDFVYVAIVFKTIRHRNCFVYYVKGLVGHSHRQLILNLFLRVLMCFLFNTWMILFHRTHYSCALAHTRTTCPTIKLVCEWSVGYDVIVPSSYDEWRFFSFVFQSLRWSHSIWCWFTYGFFAYAKTLLYSWYNMFCLALLSFRIPRNLNRNMFSRIFYFSILRFIGIFLF
jgi:hypothetical protein